MILAWLLIIPFIGGVVAWFADRAKLGNPAWIAIITLLLDLCLALNFYFTNDASVTLGGQQWMAALDVPWIPRFGISFFLAIDGLGFLMILLTLFLGIVAVMSSWNEIKERKGFFYFNILWTIAGVVGVFTALDLFLFFFFWEVMLIPMYFIIGIFGHENRIYAAIKFFIFTQVSGLLMLLAMVVLVYFHHKTTGVVTFNYFELLHTDLSSTAGYLLMLGFFIAFVTKLPGFPVHTWLPDAHTQAPTAGSVILAGILLKTGAYGLIRFAVPLFPEASAEFAPIAMLLGVISIIYAAAMAFAQTDIKRLIAYTSISHMGFVLLGIYAGNEIAEQGAIMTMLAHGMTSAALFAFAGSIQQRIHTRDMREMGGFWVSAPRMGAIVVFFSVASLGMPGLANFVGEFLALLGAFEANATLTVFAAIGMILAPVYSLIVIQRIFHGKHLVEKTIPDFSARETIMMTLMMAVTVILGVYPQPVMEMITPSLELLNQVASADVTSLDTATFNVVTRAQ